MSNDPDVLIIGAGIFGLSTAFACLKAGMRVRVVDSTGVGAGASGGIVGALSPHAPERWDDKKEFQFAALVSAGDHWREVAKIGGLDAGYQQCGRLQPIRDAGALVLAEERVGAALDLWQGAGVWEVLPPDAAPHLIVPDSAPFGVIRDTLSARIDPVRACAALGAAITALGGEITTDWPVERVEAGAIHGPKGTMQARAIVVAAGIATFDLLRVPLSDIGSGVKGQAALLQVDLGADPPMVFADGVYIVPQGAVTAVGSTSENQWDDPASIDARLDKVIAKARAICPALQDTSVIRRWAGLRARTRIPDPMLGAVPGMPGVYVASAAYKIGFGIGHHVGGAMAAMVAGARPVLPARFAVERHIRAGGANRLAKPASAR